MMVTVMMAHTELISYVKSLILMMVTVIHVQMLI